MRFFEPRMGDDRNEYDWLPPVTPPLQALPAANDFSFAPMITNRSMVATSLHTKGRAIVRILLW